MAEEIAKIQNVSAETKNAVARKSAQTLPNRPSEQGYSAEEIKRRFYQPILDAANSAFAEIDRVVNEMNNSLSQVGAFIDSSELKAPYKLTLTSSLWIQVGAGQYEYTVSQAAHGIESVNEISIDMYLMNTDGRLVNVNNYEIYSDGRIRLYNDNPGGGFVSVSRNRDGFVRGDIITDVENIIGIAKVAKTNSYNDLNDLPDLSGALRNEEMIAKIISGAQKVSKASSADSATSASYATNAGVAGTATDATNAINATNAGSAVNAANDADGNQISTTYVKKSDRVGYVLYSGKPSLSSTSYTTLVADIDVSSGFFIVFGQGAEIGRLLLGITTTASGATLSQLDFSSGNTVQVAFQFIIQNKMLQVKADKPWNSSGIFVIGGKPA